MMLYLRFVQLAAVCLAAAMGQAGAEALAAAPLNAVLLLAALPLVLFALAMFGQLGKNADLAATLFGIIAAVVVLPSLIMPVLWSSEASGLADPMGMLAPLLVVQTFLIVSAAAMAHRASTKLVALAR
ncbi:hypothetical protein [Allohahella marinimesophila]|uniref:Uncharacterized protein n=1 Tax=Allohahella marinimesophila TaxID=1054972 RepID=A0ABP7PVA2_9GAMM